MYNVLNISFRKLSKLINKLELNRNYLMKQMDLHGILWLEMMEFLIFKDGKDFKESKEEVVTVLQKTRYGDS